ncbi:hypothetical protein BH11PSE3_BH11PSE3_32210 [soil metagenome]
MAKLIAPALAAALFLIVAPLQAQTDPGERSAIPSKGLLWGSKMTLESEACCTAAAGAQRPDRAEAAVLDRIPDRAGRDGPILKLRLQGGHTLKITDCDVEDACEAERFRAHRLTAWLAAPATYVLKVKLYDSDYAYLVSERTGRTTNVAALPVVSPTGRQAVALATPNGGEQKLEIIDFGDDEPKVLVVSSRPRCGVSAPAALGAKPVWTDESHVRFEGAAGAKGAKQVLHIGAGKAEWQC